MPTEWQRSAQSTECALPFEPPESPNFARVGQPPTDHDLPNICTAISASPSVTNVSDNEATAVVKQIGALQASQQWRGATGVLSRITSATQSASKTHRKGFFSIRCAGTNFAHDKGRHNPHD